MATGQDLGPSDLDQRITQKLAGQKQELLTEIGKMLKLSTAESTSELSKLSRQINAETPNLKRKSNEEQFKLNSKIQSKLDEAVHAQELDQCKAFAQEGSSISVLYVRYIIQYASELV